jgi:hypothetical protein
MRKKLVTLAFVIVSFCFIAYSTVRGTVIVRIIPTYPSRDIDIKIPRGWIQMWSIGNSSFMVYYVGGDEAITVRENNSAHSPEVTFGYVGPMEIHYIAANIAEGGVSNVSEFHIP